jgi:hypothetical protein
MALLAIKDLWTLNRDEDEDYNSQFYYQFALYITEYINYVSISFGLSCVLNANYCRTITIFFSTLPY